MKFYKYVIAAMALLAGPVTAGEDKFCEVKSELFSIMQGPDGTPAIGAEIFAGTYVGVTDQQIRKAVADYTEERKQNCAEWLFVKKFDLEKEGKLEELKAMCEPLDCLTKFYPTADQLKATNENAIGIKLRARIEFGPYIQIAYQPILAVGPSRTPSLSYIHNCCLQKTTSGLKFAPSDMSLFDIVTTIFLHYDPPDFKPTDRHIMIIWSIPDNAGKQIGHSFTTYVRVQHPMPLEYQALLKNMVAVYAKGSDENVLKLWDETAKKEVKLDMKNNNNESLLRDFYKEKGPFNPLFSVEGKEQTYLIFKAEKTREYEQLRTQTITRSGKALLLTKEDFKSPHQIMFDRMLLQRILEKITSKK